MGDADYDSNSLIFLTDINRYVTSKLTEWGLTNRKEQKPTLQLDVTGDIFLVYVPKEASQDLPATFTITSGAGPITVPSEDISNVFKEIIYMSNEELDENREIFTNMYNLIDSEQGYNKKIEKSKQILECYLNSRFSASNILYYFMPVFILITAYKDIKKWISDKPAFKEIFIREFVNSGSFNYAGITSKIICNLIPSFTDDELLEIINGIETNDQIIYSFSARKNVYMIINASRMILSPDEFDELKKLYEA